jgi:hypothetical protein
MSKRGEGIRRRVTSTNKTSPNWRDFLRNNDNNTELFHYLAETISQEASTTHLIIVTKGSDAISKQAEMSRHHNPMQP